jgi:Trk K+ transport system NAD-binding subunit
MRGYKTVVFFVLRRMRPPLFMLLGVYAVAIVGMTLISGKIPNENYKKEKIVFIKDEQGQIIGAEIVPEPVVGQEEFIPWKMDFFHAVYFISYTGTTIGFGELPHGFTGAQRLWVIFSAYMTVVCWIYAIGSLISLVQDETFQRALKEGRFLRNVLDLHEPFYIICGYGETGRVLVRSLEERFMRAVVLESSQSKLNDLVMENYPIQVPYLCADAAKPQHLIEAGLTSRWCTGIVAVTGDNVLNLHIAITAHLLNHHIKMICQVDSREVARNMASFGADYQVQVNQFDIFAYQMQLALQYPKLYALREWLAGRKQKVSNDPMRLPRKGLWVLCGFGRFGQTLYNKLRKEKDIEIVIIEATPDITGIPKDGCKVINGWGTEMVTLLEARVNEAVGIIAGTNNDTNNLSIVVTSRELNPDLFVIMRQNHISNQPLFDAANADVVMQPHRIVADRIRVLLTSPLLVSFITMVKQEKTEDWTTRQVIKPIKELLLKSCDYSHLTGEEIDENQVPAPQVWEMTLDKKTAPAVLQFVSGIKLKHLMTDPRDIDQRLHCIPLILISNNKNEQCLLPSEEKCLVAGDRILWCGTKSAMHWMDWILVDQATFSYITLGRFLPQSHLWRYLTRYYQQVKHKKPWVRHMVFNHKNHSTCWSPPVFIQDISNENQKNQSQIKNRQQRIV